MTESTRCTIIVNPTSGRERAPRYIPLLHTTLAKRYDNITIKLTEKAGDATEFARIAAEKGRDVTVWAVMARSMKSSMAWYP